jgi:hypothetical protein
MIKKASYEVFKTNESSLEKYDHKKYYEDEYGRSQIETVEKWRLTSPNIYYIKDDNIYYDVAPSGKYNEYYGQKHSKYFKLVDYVGTYDGEKFDFEIPYLWSSIFELNYLDVFHLEKGYDHTSLCSLVNGVEKYIIPPNLPLVLESHLNLNHYGGLQISYLDNPGKKFSIVGDHKVQKIGRVEYFRKYIPDTEK